MAVLTPVSAGGATTGSVPVTGAGAGAIVLLGIAIDTGAATFTYPAGFTELGHGALTIDGHSWGLAWKRLTGTDTGTYAITPSATANNVSFCVALTGRHATNPPVLGTGTSNNTANTNPVTITASSITAVAGDDILHIAIPDVTAIGVGNGFSAWSLGTEILDVEGPTGALWVNVGMAKAENIGAGATGSETTTFALSGNTAGWYSVLVRVPSAAGVVGGSATATAKAVIMVSGRKGAAAAVNPTAKANTITSTRKGGQGASSLTVAANTSVSSSKGARGATVTTAKSITSATSSKGGQSGPLMVGKMLTSAAGAQSTFHGGAAMATARAITFASGLKGAMTSTLVSAKAQTINTGRKGAASTSLLIAKGVLSTPVRKGALGGATMSVRALTNATGTKQGQMATLTTARALLNVASGVPAHAATLTTAAALTSAVGRKGALNSATITCKGIFSSTQRKGAASVSVVVLRSITPTSTRKGGRGPVQIGGSLLLSSTGRKGGRSVSLLVATPIIVLGRHVYNSTTSTFRAILSATGVASTGALLLRDHKNTGFIDEGHAGFVTDNISGDINEGRAGLMNGPSAGRIEP